jgi:leucyl/phenylalanyl-tRNA--protein transferase
MSVEMLVEAYTYGIFPWPHKDSPVLWFSPEERGVLDFKDFHISRSFKKEKAQLEYQITFNKCFPEVIEQCAKVYRPGEAGGGTWVTEHIMKHFIELHRCGFAHSVECWMNGELAGGLYGVYVGGVFSGESMFFHKSGASKLCLIHLVEVLKENHINWMDIQMVTDVLKQFGGKYISRHQFLKRLEGCRVNALPLEMPS